MEEVEASDVYCELRNGVGHDYHCFSGNQAINESVDDFDFYNARRVSSYSGDVTENWTVRARGKIGNKLLCGINEENGYKSFYCREPLPEDE